MEKYKTITAMICITVLEAAALFNGVNGTVFMIVIAALAGLGGYEAGIYKNKQEEKWVS